MVGLCLDNLEEVLSYAIENFRICPIVRIYWSPATSNSVLFVFVFVFVFVFAFAKVSVFVFAVIFVSNLHLYRPIPSPSELNFTSPISFP